MEIKTENDYKKALKKRTDLLEAYSFLGALNTDSLDQQINEVDEKIEQYEVNNIDFEATYYFNKTTAFKILGNSLNELTIEILGDDKVNLSALIKSFEFSQGLKFGTITKQPRKIGKGQGVIIPEIDNWDESVIVLDPMAEK